MTNCENNIIMKEELNKEDYDVVKRLEAACLGVQKTELKLELDFKMRHSTNFVENRIMAEFLYYDSKILVGYLGLCNFGGDTVEISGMVHPKFRGRGIYKKLFLIAKEEWQKISPLEVLALCDHTSTSGLAFINSQAGEYVSSEYKMCFNKKTSEVTHDYVINLRLATSEDAAEINRQTSIYFGDPEKDIETGIEPIRLDNTFISYLAELKGEIIGKIHISVIDNEGFIYGFGVLPYFRGKGYGREILNITMNILKEKNIENIFLDVATENKSALDLYESCGFEEISVMDYYVVS
ncbi:GNAT family N-acetyltransferase [Clostridium algoriphilum]|uniref:GNAT family N-acetyltransferase n=1 Tax=Clostridium algoriphilum TaxID=198347 RepID=UPI001CF39BE4|nr:GNAT family N-acetyltransferase [Clostridium algoriphilum]MCB2294697.1 GNAT family N-acetyltransferase [Clostridium algoriphilum]